MVLAAPAARLGELCDRVAIVVAVPLLRGESQQLFADDTDKVVWRGDRRPICGLNMSVRLSERRVGMRIPLQH